VFIKGCKNLLLNEYVSLLNSLTYPPIAAATVPKSRARIQIDRPGSRHLVALVKAKFLRPSDP